MLRNQREERLKFVRREQERCDELWDKAREWHLVELEKPQHAGWEIHVELSEGGKRRRDAPEIQALIDLLGWGEPRFIRNLSTIRVLRRHNYRYHVIRTALTRKQFKLSYHIEPFYYTKGLYDSQYQALLPKYQGYFHLDTYEWNAAPWRGKKYILNWNAIPTYELVFKLKKAYWTHLRYYDGDAQGEYRRLHDKLWEGSYSQDVHRACGFENRYRESFNSALTCAWKTATKKIRDFANTYGVDCEEWDDTEMHLRTQAGCYKHMAFGWD